MKSWQSRGWSAMFHLTQIACACGRAEDPRQRIKGARSQQMRLPGLEVVSRMDEVIYAGVRFAADDLFNICSHDPDFADTDPCDP